MQLRKEELCCMEWEEILIYFNSILEQKETEAKEYEGIKNGSTT